MRNLSQSINRLKQTCAQTFFKHPLATRLVRFFILHVYTRLFTIFNSKISLLQPWPSVKKMTIHYYQKWFAEIKTKLRRIFKTHVLTLISHQITLWIWKIDKIQIPYYDWIEILCGNIHTLLIVWYSVWNRISTACLCSFSSKNSGWSYSSLLLHNQLKIELTNLEDERQYYLRPLIGQMPLFALHFSTINTKCIGVCVECEPWLDFK